MALVCEDLARYGVVLVPPSTTEYFELLADIERRLQTRPEGSPPVNDETISRISEHDTSGSAILLNRAQVAIASIAYGWSNTLTCLPGTNPSVLLPFGMDERRRRFDAYWNTIFPGSKRLMTCDGWFYGDNTDVRSPAADELSRSGAGWWSVGAGRGFDRRAAVPVKLTLDGVFFVDGGFAGPNQLGSWEQTWFAAEAHLACGAMAREARGKGTPAAEFFAQVQAFTGSTDEEGMPVPPPPHWGSMPVDPEATRNYQRRMVGWRVAAVRKHSGDEAAFAQIEGWADAPVPRFHKL
jgi:hypothetical protein